MEVRFVEVAGNDGPQASLIVPLTAADQDAAAPEEVPLRERA